MWRCFFTWEMDTRACYTITFSDVAENGPGMQRIGHATKNTFTYGHLLDLHKVIPNSTFIDICGPTDECEQACVLVVKGFNKDKALEKELDDLNWDSKAIFRGTVKNKIARHNLCFADFSQEADYASGKGTVINFRYCPILSNVRFLVHETFNLNDLNAEGNKYYNPKKCGIGYHGDKERRMVIGIRVGEPINLCFQWYYQCKPVGERYVIKLNDGDLYVMSEKAVGTDWKKRSQYTIRHAAGCKKYTGV